MLCLGSVLVYDFWTPPPRPKWPNLILNHNFGENSLNLGTKLRGGRGGGLAPKIVSKVPKFVSGYKHFREMF